VLLFIARRVADQPKVKAKASTPGPQHVERRADGLYIAFRQVKAKDDEKLYSFIADDLQEVMDRTPQRGLVFVTTEAGSRFASDNSFGNFLAKAIAAAGIGGVTAHGLRATTATAVADALGTVHQIKAVTGHRKDDMAAKYTRRANQARLSKSAIDQVVPILGNKKRTES
jgi:integrase